jgi:hypothetical protein
MGRNRNSSTDVELNRENDLSAHLADPKQRFLMCVRLYSGSPDAPINAAGDLMGGFNGWHGRLPAAATGSIDVIRRS